MKLHHVFSEMPYAVALSHPYLKSQCSFCVADASNTKDNRRECDRGCKLVVYCSEACLQSDRPLHEYECLAMRQGKWPGNTDTANLGVRLMGRMVSRYRLDKGVAVLSNGFPSHVVKDRCFDDLMTHARELRRSSCHEEAFKEVKEAFYEFFKDTPLGSTEVSMVRKFFYRLAINGFSLNVRLKPNPESAEELGEVIYLNASRFNHSCEPTCLYRFDGARIVIEYIDNSESASQTPIQLTKEQFENLTLQYGYGSYYNFGTTCPLTEQRRQSLKARYFFTCKCDLCLDECLDEIQLNGARVECTDCKRPCVWRRVPLIGTVKLKPTCKCPSAKWTQSERAKMTSMFFGTDHSLVIKRLNREWNKVMRLSLEAKKPQSVIRAVMPVLELAEKYWHPMLNLRLAQLNEKVFSAMQELKVKDGTKFVGDESDLKLMLKTGDAMLSTYSCYFQPYMTTVASYAADLAALYKLRGRTSLDWDRFSHWYNFAIKAWTEREESDCARFVEEQLDASELGALPDLGEA